MKPLPTRAALAAVLGYLALGAVQRERAEDALRAVAEARGHAVERAEVFPTLGNQIVWRGLYASGDSLYADRLRVPYLGQAGYAEGYAVAAAAPPAGRDAERFAWLASGWLARDPLDPTLLGDARYSLFPDRYAPVWAVRLEPETAWIDRSRERPRSGSTLFEQIRGDDPALRPMR
jgi:inner membrane protein